MGEITHIFSTLVPPGHHKEEPVEISGTAIPLDGDLFAMLATIYDKANDECTIPVRFVGAADGTQTNEVRSAFIELVANPSLARATKLGERLSGVTTGRSGLGLLFFVVGVDGKEQMLLVSRFPAHEGVLAEMMGHKLTVEFVKRVFMKSAATYKAAFYRSTNPPAEFWEGMVVDKQMNELGERAANYWIREFLKSDLRTTSKAGSRRLASALRDAARKASSLEDKEHLISAISLMAGLKGQTISPRQVFERFGLAEHLQKAVVSHLPNDESVDAPFVLDSDEFRAIARYRSVEMNTGGVLTAASEDFDKVFKREVLNEKQAVVRISTVGTIVDETVKGRQ